MKKVNFLFFVVSFALLATLFAPKILMAQDCEPYFPIKVGAKIEMTNFDANGKALGKNTSEILEKTEIPGGIALKVKSIVFDKKGKEIMNNTYDAKCENGMFYLDMRNFMPAENSQMFSDMDANIETNYLEFPNTLQVGQTLPDGSLTVNMNSGGLALLSMNINIKNRKVEALEEITTAAGTFNCFKITQETELKTFMNMSTNSITWYAKNIGAVRTESYNKKGKLTGYSEITAFQE